MSTKDENKEDDKTTSGENGNDNVGTGDVNGESKEENKTDGNDGSSTDAPPIESGNEDKSADNGEGESNGEGDKEDREEIDLEKGAYTFDEVNELIIKHNKKIARKSWKGKMYLLKISGNRIGLCVNGNIHAAMKTPWIPTSADLKYKDWVIV